MSPYLLSSLPLLLPSKSQFDFLRCELCIVPKAEVPSGSDSEVDFLGEVRLNDADFHPGLFAPVRRTTSKKGTWRY